MAGKPYGIREMKVIVDYLVEQKAFGEIRGRKRWMDLANSQITTRTWQSLKETFLKRILPDIHNPYYELTMTQIRSFKEARDFGAEKNNKLEIRNATDDSSNIDENQEQNDPTGTIVNKENQEESTAGETICSKIPPHSRCSVETLVLDHEVEDLDKNKTNAEKSMRDRIIYTDTLTPILQQVIDDFNTDEDEGQLNIDENPKNGNTDTETESVTITEDTGTIAKVQSAKDTHCSHKVPENTEQTNISMPEVNGNIEIRPIIEGSTQTQKTNTSTDSALPNNQEILVQNDKTLNNHENNANKFTETQQNEETNNVDKRSRKRTPSVASNHSTNKVTSKSPILEKQENLCLKSVSLFAEQFSAPTFINSDSSEDAGEDQRPDKKQETKLPKVKVDIAEEVLLLESHSDPDSEPLKSAKCTNTVNKTQTLTKTQSKAMANVFGFSSGGAIGKHMGVEKRSLHHKKNQDIVISDSEWSSEGDSEFVSPPRARRNRYTKKYIRPSSARIFSLEEEGGLFVVYRKKIYPLVKDGKMIKNYVNYFEEPDAEDEEESYWKLKYAQEKLKTAELSKLLENKSVLPAQAQTSNSKDKIRRQSPKKPKFDTEVSENEQSIESDNADLNTKRAIESNEKNIKIKFCGNDKEVQLEGHWSQIHPALQQVVNIFQREPESKVIKEKNETQKKKPPTKNLALKKKTNVVIPIINEEEISEDNDQPERDINELEASIFKEIEEKDIEQNLNKVSKRTRGRQNKSLSDQPSPAKLLKLDEKIPDVLPKRTVTTRRTQEKTYNSPQTKKSVIADDSEEILYKFPSPPPSDLKTNRISTRQKSKQRNSKYNEQCNETFSPPENKSLHSESTQGYQDSDISPITRRVRKRRKHSFSSLKNLPTKHRVKRFTRRRSHPDLIIGASSDSSNSTFNVSLKTTVFKNSSLNSDVYKSESYQLLMPKTRGHGSFKLLERIDETKPITGRTNPNSDNSDALSLKSHDTIIVSINNDERNSSNVSLPISPELSIVEKLSVNKSLLSSDIDFPTYNEIQNNKTEPRPNNKYLLSEVDSSIPLMQQECSYFKEDNMPNAYYERSIKPTSDSLPKPEEINSSAQSLHVKLRDLILNSAKKIVEMSIDTSQKEQPMEVDSSKVEAKKIRKKRSSTPQKRAKPQINKTKNKPPVIEERVEFCSNGGRHSCPPSVLAPIENDPNPNLATANDTSETQNTKIGRRKKDIIKVKILRPKSRTPKKSKAKPIEATSNASNESSLGTNESGIFVQTTNDTIDLIHNHSETCLHAQDCIDSSVEILPASKSHITIHSDSNTFDDFLSEDLANFNIPEMFCSNAQDASDLNNLSSQEPDNKNTANLIPHLSDLSIFTEDLSNELPALPGKSSKWYLLSEDETTNINLPPLRGGLTANLNQIFPIVCAVPDLSTITESSKDADSRKPTFEPDRDDSNSQSVVSK